MTISGGTWVELSDVCGGLIEKLGEPLSLDVGGAEAVLPRLELRETGGINPYRLGDVFLDELRVLLAVVCEVEVPRSK